MEIIKQILAGIIFLSMVYISFENSILFGIIFLASGIYALIFHNAWERPGIPILWFMGALICRVALLDILLPILKYETLVDIVISFFAFGVVYLIGYKVKNS